MIAETRRMFKFFLTLWALKRDKKLPREWTIAQTGDKEKICFHFMHE